MVEIVEEGAMRFVFSGHVLMVLRSGCESDASGEKVYTKYRFVGSLLSFIPAELLITLLSWSKLFLILIASAIVLRQFRTSFT